MHIEIKAYTLMDGIHWTCWLMNDRREDKVPLLLGRGTYGTGEWPDGCPHEFAQRVADAVSDGVSCAQCEWRPF